MFILNMVQTTESKANKLRNIPENEIEGEGGEGATQVQVVQIVNIQSQVGKHEPSTLSSLNLFTLDRVVAIVGMGLMLGYFGQNVPGIGRVIPKWDKESLTTIAQGVSDISKDLGLTYVSCQVTGENIDRDCLMRQIEKLLNYISQYGTTVPSILVDDILGHVPPFRSFERLNFSYRA